MRVTGGNFYVVGGITAMPRCRGDVPALPPRGPCRRTVGGHRRRRRWCTFISAPILQATYTESLALLLVVVNLMLIRARRYWWTVVALVFLALTRNVVIAMVPVLLAHGFVRWRTERDEFRMRDKVMLGLLIVEAGALTFLWPAIIGAVMRNPAGYADTRQRRNADETENEFREAIPQERGLVRHRTRLPLPDPVERVSEDDEANRRVAQRFWRGRRIGRLRLNTTRRPQWLRPCCRRASPAHRPYA